MTQESVAESHGLVEVSIKTIVIDEKERRSVNQSKVESLAESIKQIGLLNPVTITSGYKLVAGLHRIRAHELLGRDRILARIKNDLSGLKARLAEIDENLIRNELSELDQGVKLVERKKIYLELYPETGQGKTSGNQYTGQKRETENISFSQDTAKKVGITERTVRNKTRIGEQLEQFYDDLKDTKIADNQSELLAIAKMDKAEARKVVDKIKTGESSKVKDAKKSVKEEKKKAAVISIQENIPKETRHKIIHGSIDLTLASEPESVDWIITDPPYPRNYLNVYEKLGEVAAHCLKPGGLLLAMCGQSYLPDIMQRLFARWENLNYLWTIAYLTPGGQAVQVFPRRVNTFWKPVLVFSKGEYKGDWYGDVTKSAVNDNDKRFHGWGQSESGMLDLMNRFVKPGDTVMDPFVGGGTTAVIALYLGAYFVGYDIDEKAISTTLERLSETEIAA